MFAPPAGTLTSGDTLPATQRGLGGSVQPLSVRRLTAHCRLAHAPNH